MHGDRESESGGAPITPSARPGIHDHRNHPLKTVDEMGRYGLNNQTRPRDSDAQAHNSGDEGRDEVDNVQSKFLHTSSPVNARRIDVKRKSVELTHSPFKDEDSCHTDDEFRGLELISHYESNNSRNFQCIPESARHDRSLYESSLGTPLQSRQHADQETASQQSFGIKGMLVLAVLAMLAALYYGYFPISEIVTLSPANNYYNSAKFYNEMNYLRERYKITDNSILKLQTGISTILKRQDTGSFVFAYKSNNENFDPEEFDNFMNTVASIAAKYLRNDSTQVRHIVVDGSKLEMRSHSELINKYREEVTKTGVMLVRDLDEVPSILAMAFHYYCDEYNPLVKKSAIFFTLDMAKCSHNPVEQKPTHALIEKCLQKKWSGVPKDNIRPLLNRVVSTVVDLGGD